MFRLFPDKESLFVAVVEHMFSEISATLADGADRASGRAPAEVLDAMGDAYAKRSPTVT